MVIDLQKLNAKKEKIISTLKLRGPSLPIPISKAIEESPLFTSAYLSELNAEQKLKTTIMHIGSSPIYYLHGQEKLLEGFIDYLGGREKEAALMIKKERLLEDEKVSPVMRVALRAIRDFAIPIRIRTENDNKLFWKYFLTEDSEIPSILEPKKTAPHQNSPQPNQDETVKTEEEKPNQKIEETIAKEIPEQIKQNVSELQKQPKPKKEKKPKLEDLKFANNIKDYLASKEIEILSVIQEKKKEFEAKVRLDTLLGKQEFYLIAKDKKKILEEEITLALHKAQQEKMPALILAPGEIDKKAIEHAKIWKNLVKFEKIKL